MSRAADTRPPGVSMRITTAGAPASSASSMRSSTNSAVTGSTSPSSSTTRTGADAPPWAPAADAASNARAMATRRSRKGRIEVLPTIPALRRAAPAGGWVTIRTAVPERPHRLPAPTDLLPHRSPFLFVDEILELVPGERARARWHVNPGAAFFAGHFPGNPILPGVIIIEALAQTGALAALAEPETAGKLALFAGIGKARFRRVVRPGRGPRAGDRPHAPPRAARQR